MTYPIIPDEEILAKAPEGATHFAQESADTYAAYYAITVDSLVVMVCLFKNPEHGWIKTTNLGDQKLELLSDIRKRLRLSVGTEGFVQVSPGERLPAEVLRYHPRNPMAIAVYAPDHRPTLFWTDIKTFFTQAELDEKLAAETARKVEIDNLQAKFGLSHKQAKAILDAGYKREKDLK